MPDIRTGIIVDAKDNASKVLQGLAGVATQAIGVFVGNLMTSAVKGIANLGGQITELVKSSAQIDAVRGTFENLSATIGESAVGSLQALRTATQGMVADADLMAASNKFVSMSLASSSEEAAKLANIATQLGTAMGEDATGSMENFALMLANQSIPRLDSFGISSGIVRSRIEELKNETAGLSKEDAFMTAVMEQAEIAMGKVGDQGASMAAQFARTGASMANFKDTVGRSFMPITGQIVGAFNSILDAVMPFASRLAAGVGAMLSQAFNVIKKFVVTLGNALGIDFSKIGEASDEWGSNIVISLARGMANAMSAVIKVLKTLGNIIRSWLQPGSPPKLLPDLDKWGEAAATTYMEGWGNADFGVFNQLSSTIQGYLQSLSEDAVPKDMLIPWMSSFREAIASGVNNMNDLGKAGRGVFDDLMASAEFLPANFQDFARSLVDVEIAQGNLNTAMAQFDSVAAASADQLDDIVRGVVEMPSAFREYASSLRDVQMAQGAVDTAMGDLEMATAAVTAAQENLNNVTAEYDAMLAPLSAEMKEIQDKKQAIRDQERLTKLTEILGDTESTQAEKARARLEMEEIALRAKMRSVKDERDAAIDAARDKVDASKDTEDAIKDELDQKKEALKFAEKVAKTAQKAAEAELKVRENALEVAQEAAQVQENLIQTQIQANEALKEQGGLLDGLTNSLKGIGKGIGDALAGIEEMDLGEALSMEGLTLGLGEFDEMFAEIESIFAPLEEEAAGLGETYAGLFDGLLEKKDTVIGAIQGIWDKMTEWGTAVKDEIMPWIQEKLQIFADWFVENKPLIEEFLTTSGERWAFISEKLIEAWDVIKPALDGLIELILGLATTIMEMSTGDWASAWESIKQTVLDLDVALREVLMAFFDWILGWFGTSMEDLKALWLEKWEAIKLFFIELWESIKTFVTTKWIEIGEALKGWLDGIKSTWEEIWGAVSEFFSGLWNDIKEFITTIMAEIDAIIGDDIRAIQAAWEEIWTLIWDFIVYIWETQILPKIEEVLGLIWTAISTKTEEIQNAWETVWTAISDFFSDLWDNTIKPAIDTALEELKQVWDDAMIVLKEIWSAAWGAVKKVFEELWAKIKEKIDDAITKAQEAFKSVDWGEIGRDIVKGIAGGILKKAGDIAEEAASAVRKAIRRAKRAMEGGSPSRLTAREVGEPMGEGVGVGFLRAMDQVEGQIAGRLRKLTADASMAVMGMGLGTGKGVKGAGIVVHIHGDVNLPNVQDPAGFQRWLNQCTQGV